MDQWSLTSAIERHWNKKGYKYLTHGFVKKKHRQVHWKAFDDIIKYYVDRKEEINMTYLCFLSF